MQFILKRLASAAAAVAMVAAPVAASAQANPAASLSVVRAGSETSGSSNIAAGPTATLINIGILAALVVIVLVATNDDDEDSPDSP